MKILLAVDGSDFSLAAADEVARRPWPAGSEVKVLSVVEPPVLPTTETWALPDTYYFELERAGKERAQSAVDSAEKLIRKGQEPPPEVTALITEGHTVSVIIDEAERWGADLIVVGSHGYRGLKRFLLGSVAGAVVSHANCSVEIVRRRPAGHSGG